MTLITTGVSSTVETESALAVGASLTEVTESVNVALLVATPSLTKYVIVGTGPL